MQSCCRSHKKLIVPSAEDGQLKTLLSCIQCKLWCGHVVKTCASVLRVCKVKGYVHIGTHVSIVTLQTGIQLCDQRNIIYYNIVKV